MSRRLEDTQGMKATGTVPRHHTARLRRSPTPGHSRLERWGIVGALFFGLVGTVLGALNYHNDRVAEQRHLQLEAADLLNQAWDLMGGKPGTTTIPTNQFSSPEDLELAHRLIERALKLAETGKAYSLQATYLLATDRLDEAKEAALQAIELEPEHAPAHTSLGIVLREEGNLHESVRALEQAVRLDGDEASTYINLALALREDGKLIEAARALESAIELEPNHSRSSARHAARLREEGLIAREIDEYLVALDVIEDVAIVGHSVGMPPLEPARVFEVPKSTLEFETITLKRLPELRTLAPEDGSLGSVSTEVTPPVQPECETYVAPSDPQDVRLGLESPFDNTWFEGHGIDAFFEPGVDTNLRAVVARRFGSSDGRNGSLQFRPKADGLTERELRGWDDWEIFAVDLCRTLAGHVQDVDRKVRYLDWRW